MSRSDLRAQLGAYQRRHGLTETQLAAQLDSSQPTISRLLSGKGNRRPNLLARVEALLAAEASTPGGEAWLAAVSSAANQSESFKTIVDAALTLVNETE